MRWLILAGLAGQASSNDNDDELAGAAAVAATSPSPTKRGALSVGADPEGDGDGPLAGPLELDGLVHVGPLLPALPVAHGGLAHPEQRRTLTLRPVAAPGTQRFGASHGFIPIAKAIAAQDQKFAEAMDSPASMSAMNVEVRGKKSIEPVLADSVRDELRRIVTERFGTQLAASKAFGMSQSHLSEILGGTRGPGLNFMIRLRELTGRSIDDLLGLPPIASGVEARLAKLERAMGQRR